MSVKEGGDKAERTWSGKRAVSDYFTGHLADSLASLYYYCHIVLQPHTATAHIVLQPLFCKLFAPLPDDCLATLSVGIRSSGIQDYVQLAYVQRHDQFTTDRPGRLPAGAGLRHVAARCGTWAHTYKGDIKATQRLYKGKDKGCVTTRGACTCAAQAPRPRFSPGNPRPFRPDSLL